MTETHKAPQHRLPLETHQLLLLRADGIANIALGLCLFVITDQSWWLFALLILAPDLSALGYLRNNRLGALCYNIVHSYVGAAMLLGFGWLTQSDLIVAFGAIWWCHIAVDRAFGYGFKSWQSFKRTHLSFS
ncbi:MAG: DUF4260 domain-containing protein [Maritimibacter sp.]